MVDGKLTAHHSLDQFGHVCPGLEPTKGRALPNTSGDKLEGASRNLVPACGDADDARDAPSTMGTFQRGAHDFYVARCVECVVSTPLRHANDVLLHGLVQLGTINAIGRSQLPGHVEFAIIDINGDNSGRSGVLGALNYAETDGAQSKDRDSSAGFDSACVPDGT